MNRRHPISAWRFVFLWLHLAVCGSVLLQYVALYCRVLQSVAGCVECVAGGYSELQGVTERCRGLQSVAGGYRALQGLQ